MSDVPPTGDQQGWAAPPPSQAPASQAPPGWTPPASYAGGRRSNGMGVAALVLGIVALFLSWIPVLGLGLAVLAVIFGILGLSKARRGLADNRGMAIAGLVLGGIALLIGLVVTVATLALFNTDEFRDLADCLANADSPEDEATCQQLFREDVGR